MRFLRKPILALLLAVPLLFVGCGASQKPTTIATPTTVTSPQTTSEYVEYATRIIGVTLDAANTLQAQAIELNKQGLLPRDTTKGIVEATVTIGKAGTPALQVLDPREASTLADKLAAINTFALAVKVPDSVTKYTGNVNLTNLIAQLVQSVLAANALAQGGVK